MTLKLVVTTSVDGVVIELVLKKSCYRVGRRRDNDLRIKETYVSGYHSELNRTEDGDYELKDCGSSNGTFLNGVRVEMPQKVKAGDFIKFGILKVAVVEHVDSGPTVGSLQDRPNFRKKREELTSAITAPAITGTVAPVVGGPSDPESPTGTTAPSPTVASEKSRKEIEKLQKLVEGEQEKVAKHETSLAELEEKLSRLETESDRLRSELEEKETQLTEARESEGKSLSESEEENRKNIAKLEEKLSQLEGSNRDLQEQLEKQSSKSDATSSELAERDKRIAELEKERDNLAEESKSARTEGEEATAAKGKRR